MFDIFEQPWPLLIAAAVMLLVMWIFRAVCPDHKRWWLWLVPFVIAALAFALDELVQTDTEKIREVIYKITKAVENEDVKTIQLLIADNYSDSRHLTKEHLIAHCKAKLAQPVIEKNITRISSIDLLSPKAQAVFTTRIIFDRQSFEYQAYKHELLAKVKLDLQKQNRGKWRICCAEIVELDRVPASWQDIR